MYFASSKWLLIFLQIFLYGGYFKDHVSDKDGSEKGIVHADMWVLDPRSGEWNKVSLCICFVFIKIFRSFRYYVLKISAANISDFSRFFVVFFKFFRLPFF
jgi:hypothetical protein